MKTPINPQSNNNSSNKHTYSYLISIQRTIEAMNKDNQIEILKILYDDGSIILNENKNGVRVNLSNLSTDIMTALETHIEYVKKRDSQLSFDETERDNIRRDLLQT
tara:strand:+ start:48 stop:365 length:318 start_codon:yes stop_codon:yes gene_type:complete